MLERQPDLEPIEISYRERPALASLPEYLVRHPVRPAGSPEPG